MSSFFPSLFVATYLIPPIAETFNILGPFQSVLHVGVRTFCVNVNEMHVHYAQGNSKTLFVKHKIQRFTV